MVVYLALLIPFLFALIKIVFFAKKVVWYELFIPFVVSFIFIFAYKNIYVEIKSSDTEYLQTYIVKTEYYEEWDEYIHETCTRTVSCGEDCTTTESYDCSYVRNHPRRWVIITEDGQSWNITKKEYLRLVEKFGNQSFKDLQRNYHRHDGDMYYSVLPSLQYMHVEPVSFSRTYRNKLQVASSILKLKDVTEEEIKEYKLFDYPKVKNLHIPIVLGYQSNNLNKYGNYRNSLIARKKQVKVFFLVFNNQTAETFEMQRQYWKNGNKNEVVVCIGIDSLKNIQWSNVFSWTKEEILKINIRNFINEQNSLSEYKFKKIMEFTFDETEKNFVRQEFSEYDYLQVELPTSVVIITFIITILLNIGISFWIVTNDITNEEKLNKHISNYYRKKYY